MGVVVLIIRMEVIPDEIFALFEMMENKWTDWWNTVDNFLAIDGIRLATEF